MKKSNNNPKININYDIEANDNLEIEDIGSSSPDSVVPLYIENLHHEDAEESQFTHKLNKSLEKINENFNASFFNSPNQVSANWSTVRHNDFCSDSPITLSPNNSDSEGEFSENNNNGFHRLSRNQIESSLDKYYDEDDSSVKHSNELDILITYLKGQKNLYIQSKNISQYTLNALLIPSLLITAGITIFAPFVQIYSWSGGFISGLNATSTLLITLVNYLKLESAVELFYHTANQYDKLETGLEFISSKLLFIESNKEKSCLILEKIQDTEKKICEIKEWNTIFVPEIVRSMFPVICNINIFSLIKRIETHKKRLILKFRDIKNEIRYITYTRNQNAKVEFYETRLNLLLNTKEKLKIELLCYKNAYQCIDDIFTQEIKQAQDSRKKWSIFRYNNPDHSDIAKNNPIVDKYLRSAFSS
jgi:hypothetical protein